MLFLCFGLSQGKAFYNSTWWSFGKLVHQPAFRHMNWLNHFARMSYAAQNDNQRENKTEIQQNPSYKQK